MDFLRRLFGGQAKPPPMPELAISAVVPAQLDPNWPMIPQRRESPSLSTAERNALPFEATACPSCGAEVAKPPKGRKKCVACGEYMYVFVVENRSRRLVTEADLAILGNADAERQSAEWYQAEHDWYKAVKKAGLLLSDPPDEGADLDVVGESYYHANLAGLMASLRGDPDSTQVWSAARLVREPQNPYDKNAVRVEIHGKLVGHLGSEDAQYIQPWLRKIARRSRPTYVLANIRGGRVTDGIVAPIGVTLENLPDDDLD